MTASSNRGPAKPGDPPRLRSAPGVLAAAGIALALLLPQEAAAQSSSEAIGQPMRLGPPPDTPGDPARTEEQRPTDRETAPRGTGAVEATPLPGSGVEGIEVDRLGDLNPETLGVLDPGAGGLGPRIWSGTARHVVAALLPRIPDNLTSPVLHEMARRLLLSNTAPPPRRQAGRRGTRSLLHLRVDRLMALGEIAGVAELLRAVPQRFQDDPLLRRRFEALALLRDHDGACDVAYRAMDDSDAAWWQKALAICQLARDRRDQANLTMALLREQGGSASDPFLRLYAALDSGSIALAEGALSRLEVALLLAGGGRLPDAAAEHADLAGLAALARQEQSGALLRTRAAELAAARGQFRDEALRRLYMDFTFKGERLASLQSDEPASGATLSGTEQRALLYQAVRQAESPGQRAQMLRRLFETTPEDLYLAMSRALAPFLMQLEPSANLSGFAAMAGRALYAGGRADAAGHWLTMARAESIVNPEAAAAMTALWPYAQLAGAAEVHVNGGLAAWRTAHAAAEPDKSRREQLLTAAFGALEEGEARSWIEIAADGGLPPQPMPAAAPLYALMEAGKAGRTGEVVLLTLVTVGEQGLEGCHPMLLDVALTALSAVGLEAEARQLAIEAAVANGV